MTHIPYLILFNVFIGNYDDTDLKLAQKAVNITNRYYDLERVTYVVWSKDHSEDISYFLIQFNGPVELTSLFTHNDSVILHKMKHCEHQVVFFTATLEEFEEFISLMRQDITLHIRLVLVLKKPLSEPSELATFNGVAWQNNLADIVIIYKNQTNNKISVSTYFPYSNDACGNNIPVFLESNQNMFPNKFVNFNKCLIRISGRPHTFLVDLDVQNGTVTRFSGNDAVVLKIIMNSINASYEVFEIPAYGHNTNGTTTGGFNDLINNRTDILIPSGVLNLDRYSVLLPSHGYFDPRIRWIGPKRRAIYQWVKLIIPFFNNLTPLLFLAFLAFVFVAILIRRQVLPRTYKGGSICFQAFSVLVGQVVAESKVPLLNNMFLIWNWFCFILRIAYQGVLVKSLHQTILEPKFDVLSEAVAQMNIYGGLRGFFEYYKDTPIEKRFTVMPRKDFFIYLNRTADGERFLLISDSYLIHRVRRSIQILDEPVSSSLSCLYMRPGWPAAPTINSIIVRLLEAGITKKIYYMGNVASDEEMYNNEYRHLSMSIVGSCFLVMSFMWLICSIIFGLEIAYHRYTCNRMPRGKQIVSK